MARYIAKEGKWELIDDGFKDPNSGLNGPIWCPEGGYFDKALNRKFESKKEKRGFMREHGLKMEGGDKRHLDEKGKGKVKYFYNN